MSRRFIKIKELNKITSLSTATTYRLMAESKFPKQIKVTGSKSVAWDSQEIDDWLEQRIADSKSAA
jgi:prophage regulatory protein